MKLFRSRDTVIYRIGGDEFVILFFRGAEETVLQVTNQVRERVSKIGYSISAGYAMREKNEKLEVTIRKSDSRMYEDKAVYYQTNHRDRRRRRDDTARLIG